MTEEDFFHRTELIEMLIKKELYTDIEELISITKQGFDVYIQSDSSEIYRAMTNLLHQELFVNPRAFRLVSTYLQHPSTERSLERAPKEIDDTDFIPTLFLGHSDLLKNGFGFVRYQMRSVDQLIGNIAACIEQILNYFNLGFYIDSFEGVHLTRLKQIAKVHGLKQLIDSVVQTAFLAGFKGSSENALQYLDQIIASTDSFPYEKNFSPENCAKIFLSHVVSRGENAHSFLKSCLGYHIVNHKGYSIVRASQVLHVSRTTLQEHLRLAEELNIASFFDGRLSE